jgi:predicted aconitase with swiveling domain
MNRPWLTVGFKYQQCAYIFGCSIVPVEPFVALFAELDPVKAKNIEKDIPTAGAFLAGIVLVYAHNHYSYCSSLLR